LRFAAARADDLDCTDDGLIHLTNDDGKTWENVTPPALTSWTKVVMTRRRLWRDEAYAHLSGIS